MVIVMSIADFQCAKYEDEPVKFKKKKSDDKKNNLTAWQYHNDPHSIWGKVSLDLLLSDQFQDLSKSAQLFYIILIVNKNSYDQSQCLYNALKSYYEMIGEPIDDVVLKYQCGDYSKSRRYSNLFVIPAKQIERYSFKLSYITKLKNELIDKGFIKIFANEKTRGRVDTYVTIYQFVNDWKKRKIQK